MASVTNPFALSKADYLTDRKLIDYFAAPPHIGLLEQVKPIFLKGGRGTGKTMLLRYLSFEVQQTKFLHQKQAVCWTPELASEFWGQLSSFGVYVKLNGGDTTAFKEGRISTLEWANIFTHYFNMILCSRIIGLLRSAIDNRLLSAPETRIHDLVTSISDIALDPSVTPVTLLDLQNALDEQKRSVERFLKLRAYRDVTYDERITNMAEPVEGVVQRVKTAIPELSQCPFFMLLDEYENLLQPQQRMVNTLVKLSSVGLSYKVSMRHYGFRTKETFIGNEKLEELHDYTEVVIERDIVDNPEQYQELLFEISRRRLEEDPPFATVGVTDINKILHSMSEDDEAQLLVPRGERSVHISRFRHLLLNVTGSERMVGQWIGNLTGHSPLLDKFNQVLVARGRPLGEIYQGYSEYLQGTRDNWYAKAFDNTKTAVLFLLIRDYGRRRKLYCGFPVYARLSSGVIRTYLELCERAFYYAQLDDVDIAAEGISPDHQTTAARRVADKFFDEIPDLAPEGTAIQTFVRELGSVFRQLHVDSSLRLPEATFFSLYSDQLNARTLEILHTAIRHSIVIPKRSMNTKEVDRPLPEDFFLNRILAPKFGIATTTRNRVFVSPQKMEEIIFGDPPVRANARHSLTKRRYEPPSNQLTFRLEPGEE